MKRGSTLFLRVAIILLGLPILAVCIFGLSRFDPNPHIGKLPEFANLQYPIINRNVCSNDSVFRCIVSGFETFKHY